LETLRHAQGFWVQIFLALRPAGFALAFAISANGYARGLNHGSIPLPEIINKE
jgi:hypothetical protein